MSHATPDDERATAVRAIHVMGQDLSTLSIEELDQRMAALADEIARLQAVRTAKLASRSAADSVFRI